MNILPSPTKFWQSPKLAITILDSFVVSVLTLILPQLAPLPPPSFAPNSITVIRCTTTYLSLRVRLTASNRFRTLSPVQLLKLLNPVTSLLSYALFTGSKQPNASNTNSSYSVTKSSQPPNHHICIKICLLSSQHSLFISDFIYLYTLIASLVST